MKNWSNPGGAPNGPKNGWGQWAEKRAKRIAKPRRNAAALKLNAPKKPESADTSSSAEAKADK